MIYDELFLKQKISLFLQDHEDPDSCCLKQVGNIPVLLLDQETVYVIVGKNILFHTELDNVAAAVVAFLGVFYLLDFDYPKQHEYSSKTK
jgi:hypothetical protein